MIAGGTVLALAGYSLSGAYLRDLNVSQRRCTAPPLRLRASRTSAAWAGVSSLAGGAGASLCPRRRLEERWNPRDPCFRREANPPTSMLVEQAG